MWLVFIVDKLASSMLNEQSRFNKEFLISSQTLEVKKLSDEEFKDFANEYLSLQEVDDSVFVYVYTDDFFYAENDLNVTTLAIIGVKV